MMLNSIETLLDVARRWLAEDIQVDDTIEFDVTNKNK